MDVDVEGIVALIKDAGTGRFIEAMLEFCRKCIRADFVSIFAYSETGDPTLVGTATTTAAENARKAAIGYMQYFANDVNFNLASRRRAGTYVTYQTAGEIASSRYRRACYDRTGIADRLSLVCVGPVSVYRSHGNGCFSDRELDRARGLHYAVLRRFADGVLSNSANAGRKSPSSSFRSGRTRASTRIPSRMPRSDLERSSAESAFVMVPSF